MDVERPGSVLRERGNGNMGPPATKLKATKPKKTVSAAAIFKQHSKIKRGSVTPQANLNTPKFTVEDADATTLLSVKSHSSVHSSLKAGGRVARKRSSDMHPLGVAFRDTTDDYRRHLYKTTSLKINKTLETLLQALYESTLQTIPNGSHQNLDASPLQLSAPAKYERLAIQLYQPISQYTLTLRRTDSNGKTVRLDQTLEKRMQHYSERIAEQASKVEKLQKEWEAIVGEIWKVGVGCLGEEAMESLLFTKEQRLEGETLLPASSPAGSTDAESTLFVPKHGTSPPPSRTKSRISKKHVTFLEQIPDKPNNATPTSKFPDFLYQPSRYRKDTLPIVASLSDKEREMKELKRSVAELGKKEIEDFNKIVVGQKEYWRKKTARLAIALKDD